MAPHRERALALAHEAGLDQEVKVTDWERSFAALFDMARQPEEAVGEVARSLRTRQAIQAIETTLADLQDRLGILIREARREPAIAS